MMRHQDMSCSEARALIDQYRRGELPVEEARALEHHLDTCPICSAMETDADSIGGLLRQLASESLPDDEYFRKTAARALARIHSPVAEPAAAEQIEEPKVEVIAAPVVEAVIAPPHYTRRWWLEMAAALLAGIVLSGLAYKLLLPPRIERNIVMAPSAPASSPRGEFNAKGTMHVPVPAQPVKSKSASLGDTIVQPPAPAANQLAPQVAPPAGPVNADTLSRGVNRLADDETKNGRVFARRTGRELSLETAPASPASAASPAVPPPMEQALAAAAAPPAPARSYALYEDKAAEKPAKYAFAAQPQPRSDHKAVAGGVPAPALPAAAAGTFTLDWDASQTSPTAALESQAKMASPSPEALRIYLAAEDAAFRGQYEGAITLFERAAALEPAGPLAARANLRLGEIALRNMHDAVRARAAFEKCLIPQVRNQLDANTLRAVQAQIAETSAPVSAP